MTENLYFNPVSFKPLKENASIGSYVCHLTLWLDKTDKVTPFVVSFNSLGVHLFDVSMNKEPTPIEALQACLTILKAQFSL